MAVPSSIASTGSSSLPPSAMPLISPPALLQAYLSQTPPARPSSRSPTSLRPIHLNTGSLTHTNGSAVVRLGETTIICGIRAEILPVSEIPHYRADTLPTSSQSDDAEINYEPVALNNLLVPNLELNTSSHPSFPAQTAPTTAAQSISQRILSLLLSSRMIRTSDLEIRHSSDLSTSTLDPDDPAYVEPETNVLKAYWTLYIDCVSLSYGGIGNTFDTSLLAIVAALRDVRLPSAWWDEDRKQVLCDADMSRARRLKLRALPCPLNFGLFVADTRLNFGDDVNGTAAPTKGHQGKATLLLDMDLFEDEVCDETGSVVVDCQGGQTRVLRIEKAGGSGRLGVQEIKGVIKKAEERWTEWERLLGGALQSSGG